MWDSSSRALSVVHSLSVACASPVASLEVFDGQQRLEAGRAAAMPWRRGGDLDPPPDPCLGCEKAEQRPPRTLLAAGTGAGGLYVWSCVVDRWVHGCGTTMCQASARTAMEREGGGRERERETDRQTEKTDNRPGPFMFLCQPLPTYHPWMMCACTHSSLPQP